MGLGGSSWSLDIGERLGVASVKEDGAGEDSLGSWKKMGRKCGCEKVDVALERKCGVGGWMGKKGNS